MIIPVYLKTQDRPNKEIDHTNLYVNNLPENVDDNRLLESFSPFGKITEARVIRNQTTVISKGGYVLSNLRIKLMQLRQWLI